MWLLGTPLTTTKNGAIMLDRILAAVVEEALDKAIQAVQSNRGQAVLVQQLATALQSAAQQGLPTLPQVSAKVAALPGRTSPPSAGPARAGRPLKGSLGHALNSTNPQAQVSPAAFSPRPPTAVPPPAPITTEQQLAIAAQRLNAAMASGSPDAILQALFAYEAAESAHHQQQLLGQGVLSPQAVATQMAMRRAQAEQQNLTLMSNISAMNHQTMMSIINNIR